jgi:DNA-binding MurR/RpiR family transcriptional regulator
MLSSFLETLPLAKGVIFAIERSAAVMTIKDIAKLAGVSVSTVSRALNGHPDIKSETKEKFIALSLKIIYS